MNIAVTVCDKIITEKKNLNEKKNNNREIVQMREAEEFIL